MIRTIVPDVEILLWVAQISFDLLVLYEIRRLSKKETPEEETKH